MKRKGMLLFIFLCAVCNTFGHNYLDADDTVTEIPDISVSRAVYTTLDTPKEVDVYTFEAKKGQEIYLQITIPQLERLKDFTPAFAVFGLEGILWTERDDAWQKEYADIRLLRLSDFNYGKEKIQNALKKAHVHSHGNPTILRVTSNGGYERFHEHFTGTKYLTRQSISLPAPKPGRYYVLVYSPDNDTGKYVFAPGRKERFGVLDVLGLPATRITVRQFMEESITGDVVFWSLFAAGAAVGIGFGVYKLVSR